jgi:hypothetical protein
VRRGREDRGSEVEAVRTEAAFKGRGREGANAKAGCYQVLSECY